MADDMKLQQSLRGSSAQDIPEAGIEGSRVLDVPKTGTEGSRVFDVPKTGTDGSSVLDIPKTESEYYFPTPPVSPARPDLLQEPASPVSPEGPDLWREQRWKDILSKEERTQQCTRCKEIGHGRHHCPYPVVCLSLKEGEPQAMVCKPSEGKYRCSRCGRRGHNRRTCHGPVFY